MRMVDSAVALLRERSSAGVTIDAVLAHSGAPRGSVYHHFPGGRDDLIAEAVTRAGLHVSRHIQQAASSGATPTEVVRGFVEFWERMLIRTDCLAGCPVVALTVDAQTEDGPQISLVAEVFADWHRELTPVLLRAGADPERARRLATMLISAIEGAVLLCRAQRSTQPLHDVHAELDVLLGTIARPADATPSHVRDSRG
ncbi:MAG: TetR/AcrR family transcriptional regulator [Nocardioidaceae bacterium]